MKLDLRVIVERLTDERPRLPCLRPDAERDALPPPWNQCAHARIEGRIVSPDGGTYGRLDLRTTDAAVMKAALDACRPFCVISGTLSERAQA